MTAGASTPYNHIVEFLCRPETLALISSFDPTLYNHLLSSALYSPSDDPASPRKSTSSVPSAIPATSAIASGSRNPREHSFGPDDSRSILTPRLTARLCSPSIQSDTPSATSSDHSALPTNGKRLTRSSGAVAFGINASSALPSNNASDEEGGVEDTVPPLVSGESRCRLSTEHHH